MNERPTPGRSWQTTILGKKGAEAAALPQSASPPIATLVVNDEDPKEPQGNEYQAFGAIPNRAAKMLEIRYFEPKHGIEEGDLLSMPLFVQAHYVGHEHVILEFQNAVFQIEGRGVRELISKLKQGTLHTIQQWSERHWGEPQADQPKITRIISKTSQQASETDREGGSRDRSEERAR